MRTLLVILILITAKTSFSTEKFGVSKIADSLKKNAHAVVRVYDVSYQISAPDKAIYDFTIAVTVLDKEGSAMADIIVPYDGNSEITYISGKLFDSNGTKINSAKKSDFKDYSSFGNHFADDNRQKYHTFNCISYPYTTVYDVQLIVHSALGLNKVNFLPGQHCSVETASLKVEWTPGLSVKFQPINIVTTPVTSVDAEKQSVTYTVSGLKARVFDDFTTEIDRKLPGIALSPDHFELFGNKGSMKTWREFGGFVYVLNNKLGELTPDVKAKIHALTDGLPSKKEKIAATYRYLQQNTRYVSIQFGIGGLKSADAKSVCDKKYGDCKALSNFMKSLLAEIGINSHVALVSAGSTSSYDIEDSFCQDIFNHVIACVPDGSDTVWLECTSQSLPPGYLSAFTSNRKVLLETPDGGYLVKTPDYNKQANTMVRRADLIVVNDAIKGKIQNQYKGLFWDLLSPVLSGATAADISSHQNTMLLYPTYDVAQPNITSQNSFGNPSIEETFTAIIPADAVKTGSSLIISSSPFKMSGLNYPRTDTCRSAFALMDDFRVTDTIVFHFDQGYKFEQKNIVLSYLFGELNIQYTQPDQHTLLKTVSYSINRGDYPMTLFKDYCSFYRELNRNYHERITLISQ